MEKLFKSYELLFAKLEDTLNPYIKSLNSTLSEEIRFNLIYNPALSNRLSSMSYKIYLFYCISLIVD